MCRYECQRRVIGWSFANPVRYIDVCAARVAQSSWKALRDIQILDGTSEHNTHRRHYVLYNLKTRT